MPKISFIIPVWNLWDMTKVCLESLVHCCAKDGLLDQIEIIVVDNNSSDATVTELASTLRALVPKTGYSIVLPENLGFAKACNIGAQKASGSLLFFLNNDTIMIEGCVPPLLRTLEINSKIGAVGPLLLYPGDKVQHAGICLNPSLELTYAYHLLPANYVAAQKQRFWQAITGAAFMVPKELFVQCGGFHEEYINGFEDLDLCCQIRKKGYVLTVAHKSRMYHYTSQTPGRFDHNAVNEALLGKRCPGLFAPDQHKVALEADLYPHLNPALKLYVRLAEAKEKALDLVFMQNFDEVRCLARLEKEPYWLNGYELLARYYEENQRWTEALDIRLQQAHLEPYGKNFASLEVCAAHTGDTDIMTNAKQYLVDYAEKTQDIDALQQRALRLQQWAIKNNDTALAKLFETWLQEHPVT